VQCWAQPCAAHVVLPVDAVLAQRTPAMHAASVYEALASATPIGLNVVSETVSYTAVQNSVSQDAQQTADKTTAITTDH